ncbi:MAG TPA: hypothetical protein VN622_12605 [Clostridia bacterium]|nr:hypothetical protein [Clostridia bacterium]
MTSKRTVANRDHLLERYRHVQQQRLSTLCALCAELRDVQESIVAMDLPRIETNVRAEESLCTELRAIHREITELASALDLPVEPGRDIDGTGELDIVQSLADVQSEVRQLTRVNAALVHRSRRSINVLLNVLATCCGGYGSVTATVSGSAAELGI